jgi:hypothetical protein
LLWVEKTRGMGLQKPDELSIRRELWLDDDGRGLTFQDQILGQPKQIARLDVAQEHELGVVRINGERQLITENPNTQAHGIELRTRNPRIEAIGRTQRGQDLSATGWQTDADSLRMTIYLPPGWRVLALFGADRVLGDWLTAWTLLDLFLLLIFTLAVFRIWGFLPALIAFMAYGLSYHEIGSPRLTWLFLLFPIAILRVVSEGRHTFWLRAWKGVAVAMLVLNLVPFLAIQVQNAIYPQLEPIGIPYQSRSMFAWLHATYNSSADVATLAMEDYEDLRLDSAGAMVESSNAQTRSRFAAPSKIPSQMQSQVANMQFEAGTSIQTGIAKPNWYGNRVLGYWDGPVDAAQRVRPILISCDAHRLLTVVRVVLLLALFAIVLRARTRPSSFRPRALPGLASAAMVFFLVGWATPTWGQIPDADTLRLLRERLLATPDAFPHAAEIPEMQLRVIDNELTIEAVVHAAVDVAIPMPGKLPAWSPLRVLVDGGDAIASRREDGYLWVGVPKGIHTLRVEGMLGDVTEWVWSFGLAPRQLTVEAPDWNVTGLGEDGRPEDQMFFVRKEKTNDGIASYDQRNFRSVVVVDRVLEIGLVWKIHNTVTRLSAPGKAISLQIPLLAGERVLSSNLTIANGVVGVNLGADAMGFQWESDLGQQEEMLLEAKPSAQVVERWSLITSPMWNVGHEGLQPIFEANREELIPVWHPWPGEKVQLRFRKPVAVTGKTLTIKELTQGLALGNRQRNSTLAIQVESSLGGEFEIDIEDADTITSLSLDNRPLPVRRRDRVCIVPLQPGLQKIEMAWTTSKPMESRVQFPEVALPAESANVKWELTVPETRWVLWADGPRRGPAVRFWTILVVALLIAIVLGRTANTPLRTWEWILLALGLTQVHVAAALVVVAWLYTTAWRGRTSASSMRRWWIPLVQLGLIALTAAALGVLIVVVSQGLLGSPKMFLVGNGSYQGHLKWFEPTPGARVPQPWIVSVSVWYYRFLMLAWALWLASSLLRWLQTWWNAMHVGGFWLPKRQREVSVIAPESHAAATNEPGQHPM